MAHSWPHDKKLLEMFTILHRIPWRCFQVLFRKELEVKAIKDAISQIQSIEEFIMAASGPIPFKKLTSHILIWIEPTDAQWGNPHTELLSVYVASLMYDRINLHHSMTIWNSIDCLLRTPKARGWELIQGGDPLQILHWHHTASQWHSHTSKFSNTFCCKFHKGKVYFKKQSFTLVSSENILLGVKLWSKTWWWSKTK
jgi:hypothetical protein